jgi:hypothetical protein
MDKNRLSLMPGRIDNEQGDELGSPPPHGGVNVAQHAASKEVLVTQVNGKQETKSREKGKRPRLSGRRSSEFTR